MKVVIDKPDYQPVGDLFSDLTLILRDPTQEIRLDLHRLILAWQIPYFMTSLSFQHNQVSTTDSQTDKKKEITLLVDDAETARLFFLSFYGYKTEWSSTQFFQVIKLKSYLGLDINLEELYQLKIEPEDFALFLQVINLPEIEIDGRLLRMIKRNLPKDFSWQGVDKDFKAAVLERRDRSLFSTGIDQTIKEWDLDTSQCVRTFTGHTSCVNTVVLSADRQRLFSSSDDKTIKEWDLGYQHNQGSSVKCVRTFTGHNGAICSIVLSPDQKRLFSASDDLTIKEWDLDYQGSGGQCVRTLTGHRNRVTSLVLSTDQQRLFSASYDKTIKEWDLDCLGDQDNQDSGRYVRTFTSHTDWIWSIVLSE